ncbi:MAG: hypothetical protein U5L09_04675, partial [Bacteroidales bacterium]|nr:hypothetical protein [Bacteroidales bacterium]
CFLFTLTKFLSNLPLIIGQISLITFPVSRTFLQHPFNYLNINIKFLFLGVAKILIMYVRKVSNRSGSVSVQVIQKVKGRQKVVKTVGCATTQHKIDKSSIWQSKRLK